MAITQNVQNKSTTLQNYVFGAHMTYKTKSYKLFFIDEMWYEWGDINQLLVTIFFYIKGGGVVKCLMEKRS